MLNRTDRIPTYLLTYYLCKNANILFYLNSRHNHTHVLLMVQAVKPFPMPDTKPAYHHSDTNKRCHFPLFITQLVAKLLRTANAMFHSSTSPQKESLPKMLCVAFLCLVLCGVWLFLPLCTAGCRVTVV